MQQIFENFKAEDSKRKILKEDIGTPDAWIPRHPDLIRLTGRHPFNAEPPISKLMQHGFFTPNSLFFVRNHGSVPKLDWNTHHVVVEGLINKPHKFSMDELVQMKSLTITVTFACDGNRRKEINMIRHTQGFHFGSGAVGTANFKGVRLYELLKRCEVQVEKAKYVWFEGADQLPKGNYGSCIPFEVAMDRSNEIILAYEMNGERLNPDHGFPIRLVIPGFVGGRMVKWLSRIIVSEKESDNHYYTHDHRLLPQHVDWSTSEKYFRDPRYLIYQLNINSVITSPGHEEWIPVAKDVTKLQTIYGYAYSGGGRSVTRVEVSMDHGQTWEQCEIEYPSECACVDIHGFKCWVWCHWKLVLPTWKLIHTDEIAVRAWDTSYNTQPREPTWNILGLMNNSWYRVKIRKEETIHQKPPYLRFLHPVEPGGKHGGYLYPKVRKEERHLILPSERASAARAHKQFTVEEVMKHNRIDDLFIIINREVYDITSYVNEHPGGATALQLVAGTDATKLFYDIHARDAHDIKDRFLIGTVVEQPFILPIKKRPEIYALNPRKWINITLAKKEIITHNTRRFTFDLPDKNQKLGLPIGQCVLLGADLHDQFVVRPYTPIKPVTEDEDMGYVQFVIKIYFAHTHPLFPQGGIMSQHLESLNIGDSIKMKGPVGHILYHGNGVITIHGSSMKVNKMNMIAGGTGITPVYQLMRAIASNPNDQTQISFLYANNTIDDILLHDELETLKNNYKNIRVWYTISEPPKQGEWNYSIGFVDKEMMRRHLFPPNEDTIVLMCGPPAMIEHACIPNLEELGYSETNMFEF